MSSEGVEKCNFIRDTYIVQLTEHVSNIYPELAKSEQLLRVKKLLEIIPLVKSASQTLATGITNMVVSNHANLKGRLTHDIHLRQF